jgi:hypothetical protein
MLLMKYNANSEMILFIFGTGLLVYAVGQILVTCKCKLYCKLSFHSQTIAYIDFAIFLLMCLTSSSYENRSENGVLNYCNV